MSALVHTQRDRSAAVKEAIRVSARRLFTTNGFEATGIRDIAVDADVNPAIVIRHFGSKENLFLETVDAASEMREIIDGPIGQLGARVVELVTPGRRTGLNLFGSIVRATAKPDIRKRLHESIIASLAEPLIDRIDAPDAELRAHLFAAQLTGLLSAFSVYDDDYLLTAPVEDIVALYGDSLQRILTGPGISDRGGKDHVRSARPHD